jgi:hypothetical protein
VGLCVDGFGLCALGKQPINVKQRSNVKQPGVVHELKILPPKYYTISGYVYDDAGVAVPGCEVILIKTLTDVGVETKYTNALGYYEFRSASPSQNFYVVAYLSSNPIKVGTTINTLNGI